MVSKRTRLDLGYTALEALFLLVALAVLAMTSLAVYQKMQASDSAAEAVSHQSTAEKGEVIEDKKHLEEPIQQAP